MPSQSKFLVIEGCNGVGKSTIAEYLCARVGASSFHYPPEFVSFRRDVHLDECCGAASAACLLFGGNITSVGPRARSTHTESCHLRSLSGKSPFADDRRIGDRRDGGSPPDGTVRIVPVHARSDSPADRGARRGQCKDSQPFAQVRHAHADGAKDGRIGRVFS